MTSKPTSVSRKRSKRPPAKRNRPRRSRTGPPEPAVVAFARFAKQLGVRWYVFGAQAVNLYGFPRATADLDVTVALGSLDPSDVVAKLRKAKFTPRFEDEAFIAATRVIPVVHDASASPIDIVLAGPGLEEQFLDEVVFHSIGRIKVPVLSLENLIVTKLLAGRPKDLEDVRELLPIHAVDHARVEGMLGIIEAALDQSDLRVLYRRLRAGS